MEPDDVVLRAVLTRLTAAEALLSEYKKQIHSLEKHVYYPKLSEQVSTAEEIFPGKSGTSVSKNLYAPLRPLVTVHGAEPAQPSPGSCYAEGDAIRFIKRLLDPQDLGYAVTRELRQQAKEAIGDEHV